MPFHEFLNRFTVEEVMSVLHCPRDTVYQWRTNQRKPPGWQQPIFAQVIADAHGWRGEPFTVVAEIVAKS